MMERASDIEIARDAPERAASPVNGGRRRGPSRDGLDADVLVVGAGTAGLPAAIFAARRGARVLLVDSASEPGGTLRRAAGHVSAGGTRLQRDRGIDDSPEAHAADIARITDGTADAEMVSLACELAPRTVAWLDELGLDWSPDCPAILHGLETYSVPRTYWGRDRARSIAAVLVPEMAREAEAGRIRFEPGASLASLDMRDGAVTGGHLVDGEGRERRVRAAQTVLTSGGYGANPRALRRDDPRAAALRRRRADQSRRRPRRGQGCRRRPPSGAALPPACRRHRRPTGQPPHLADRQSRAAAGPRAVGDLDRQARAALDARGRADPRRRTGRAHAGARHDLLDRLGRGHRRRRAVAPADLGGREANACLEYACVVREGRYARRARRPRRDRGRRPRPHGRGMERPHHRWRTRPARPVAPTDGHHRAALLRRSQPRHHGDIERRRRRRSGLPGRGRARRAHSRASSPPARSSAGSSCRATPSSAACPSRPPSPSGAGWGRRN